MEPTQANKDFIKNLQNFAPKHCDNCGYGFSEVDFKVLKRSSINTLLHLRCSHCGSAYMLNVLNPAQGVMGSTRVPVNLDLSNGNEVKKFAGSDMVSDDNAIDAFEALSDVDLEDKLKAELNKD